MLASPSMNMPVLCQAYNPYSPAAQSIMQASPSNTFAHSPGSSTYSASPINSPQQAIPPEDFMRYGMRQNFRHALPQTQDYGYFYNDYTGNKRRKRDEEVNILFFFLHFIFYHIRQVFLTPYSKFNGSSLDTS